jgi:hypothetical protein
MNRLTRLLAEKQHRYPWVQRFLSTKHHEVLTPSGQRIVKGSFIKQPGKDKIAEACRRLGVEPIGPIHHGMDHRTINIMVEQNGARYWMKLSGIQSFSMNEPRRKELSAPSITGVRKPSIFKTTEWISDDDVHWLALQMTLAPSAVEQGLWASTNAQRVTDDWIASLKTTLDILGNATTTQYAIRPERIKKLIVRYWGKHVPHIVDEWRFAHGDLQWSNLTAPDLILIDWEFWGLAPRGYDAARLIVFSVGYPDLVRRLEVAFADDLATASGRVALLALAAEALEWIDNGHSFPRYRELVVEMAKRILSGR